MPYKDFEKRKERGREYYQEKREMMLEKTRKWYRENREKAKEYNRRYRQKHERIDDWPTLFRSEAWCQFDGCEIKDRYMLGIHHLFPGDEEAIIILCLNHHGLIDHKKEGFYISRRPRKYKKRYKKRRRSDGKENASVY